MKSLGLKIGLLGLGLLILFMSTARTSLDFFENEHQENIIRNNPTTFKMINRYGVIEQQTYKFTAVGLLPNSPIYIIKWFRDWLWLTWSRGPEKAKVALLLGDKRLMEADGLLKINDEKLAIKTANEAIDKLEYAYISSKNLNLSKVMRNQLLDQIYVAGYAYQQVFVLAKGGFTNNLESYNQLINRINEWNKKQERSTPGSSV